MKIKIESDGTTNGTFIKDIDTDEILRNVTEISWKISAHEELAEVNLKLVKVPVHVLGETKKTKKKK